MAWAGTGSSLSRKCSSNKLRMFTQSLSLCKDDTERDLNGKAGPAHLTLSDVTLADQRLERGGGLLRLVGEKRPRKPRRMAEERRVVCVCASRRTGDVMRTEHRGATPARHLETVSRTLRELAALEVFVNVLFVCKHTFTPKQTHRHTHRETKLWVSIAR